MSDQTSHMQQLFPIAVMSFNELGPQLLKLPNLDYLLSNNVLSQDPLEHYFSHQIQQVIYRDLKTMDVEQEVSNLSASQPLKKCPRITLQ